MYKSFEVKNFRCFRELKLDKLERVNLIAGVNNIGKTTLLEALFFHCAAYRPDLSMQVNAFRGIISYKVELGRWAETPWVSFFNKFDVSKKVELIGEDGVYGRHVMRLSEVRRPKELAKIDQFIEYDLGRLKSVPLVAKVLKLEHFEAGGKSVYYMICDTKGTRTEPIPSSPPFPSFFQPARLQIPFKEEAERFGNMQTRGEEGILLEVLKVIEPRLRRLVMVFKGEQPMLHGDIGMGFLIPLPVMGEGMVRLASLTIHMGNAQKGVVLVDEIENGLHYSILPKVWRALGKAARKFDTQVFATTHSLECIVAAHEAFSKGKIYDFRLHRLERIREDIHAITYDPKTLAAAIETGLEVR